MPLSREKLDALIYEALETELGGEKLYETAVSVAQNPDLRKEWKEYLEQTRKHARIVRQVCADFGLDPEKETPGRQIVRRLGESFVDAIRSASATGPMKHAEIVAAECVTLAETKDHLNWELLGACVKELHGPHREALHAAVSEVEDEEDEHLYHTAGWTRELHLANLGLRAVLPPPEEQKDVKTAIGAARAKQERGQMRSKKTKDV
jgi:hypothetical protein